MKEFARDAATASQSTVLLQNERALYAIDTP